MNADANRMRKENVMHGVYLMMRWSRSRYMYLELTAYDAGVSNECAKKRNELGRSKQDRMRQK
jgi:hypothetical protein